MNKSIKNIFVFTVGAAIGSAVTWKIVKTKYERIAQDEINSVKEAYSKCYKEDSEDTSIKETENDPEEDEQHDSEWSEYLEHAGTYSGDVNETRKKALELMRPYVITPEDFGELDDYDTTTLYYYSDGVLATQYDEPIGNIDDVVGIDALDRFGEHADDAVFVRNDRLRTDYEIIYSPEVYTGLDNNEIEYS